MGGVCCAAYLVCSQPCQVFAISNQPIRWSRFNYSLAYGLVNPQLKGLFMHHSFDVEIATRFGVNVAIFLNNVAFWIKKNQANNEHFYDGRYWTYNSSDALSEIFPYWSPDQMDRLIKKCTSLGLLVIDNFNKKTYDRTRWYGLTDKSLELFNLTLPRNRGMDPAKPPNPSREIAGPIPDINTDINTDNKSFSASRFSESEEPKPEHEQKPSPKPVSSVSPSMRQANEVRHDWAAMKNESSHIAENETFKRVPPPKELKGVIEKLKRRSMVT